MLTKIDGLCFKELIGGGIESLLVNKARLNDLNVFPVPDGDTGTNMLMTARYGFEAIKDKELTLGEMAGTFASSAVFGARGNSGVILSQFFKGIASALDGACEADAQLLHKSLAAGCEYAYKSVAKPVEGTMLTVLRDAAAAAESILPTAGVDALIGEYLAAARVSLDNTPNLLPILKEAGVVDSGACGIVCFFEGIEKRIKGEEIGESEEVVEIDGTLDLTKFNKNTSFEYGYCVEGLVQLKVDEEAFSVSDFKSGLEKIGSSIVATLEGDKLKLHVHTKKLGRVMDYCQKLGEFLTVKVENMSVQHIQRQAEDQGDKLLYSRDGGASEFKVVAVATSTLAQKMLFDMGADVVILSDIAPSSQEFMDAFALADSKNIIVFPNSPNSVMTSVQAGKLYDSARVTVLNSRSLAECYAALSVMDFDADADSVIADANTAISGAYHISIYHADKDIMYGDKFIERNEFFALAGKQIIEIDDSLEETAVDAARRVCRERECAVITLFYGVGIAEKFVEKLKKKIESRISDVEVVTVSTEEALYSLMIMFE
ncbi:MAG: DAK2 domain-containing protein [Clostridia bacterium]|nr:DAK2 domain-containing protein [Clostridia bacterium]